MLQLVLAKMENMMMAPMPYVQIAFISALLARILQKIV